MFNANHANRKTLTSLFIAWTIFTAGIVAANVFFADQIGDPRVIWRTLLLGLCTAIIAIPLGSLVAWGAMGRGWLSRLLLLSTIGLLAVPLFSHVSGWDSALGKLGWLTSKSGQVLKPLIPEWWTAVWVHAIGATPFVAIITMLGLGIGRRTHEEQALLDSTPWTVFWNVTFWRLLPLMILSLLWIFVSCSREIAATDIYRIGTLAEQIYLGYSLGQLNTNIRGSWTPDQMLDAQTLSLAVRLVVVGWLSLSALLLFTATTDEELLSNQWKPASSPTTRNSIGRMIVILFSLVLLVIIPAANLFYRASFFVQNVEGVPTQKHSFDHMLMSLRRVYTDYSDSFTWSFLISATSATFILVIAIGLAWLARKSRFWKLVFVFTLAISCAVPGPLLGTWLVQLFTISNARWLVWLYDRTITAPVIANTIFCWPLAAMIVWFSFRKVAADALESASLEGAGRFQQLVQFGITSNPLLIPGCWLITFAVCFGELSASQLVLPPGIDSVPRLTLGLLHAGVNEMTAALTIVTIIGIVLVSLLGWGLICLNQGTERSTIGQ